MRDLMGDLNGDLVVGQMVGLLSVVTGLETD